MNLLGPSSWRFTWLLCLGLVASPALPAQESARPGAGTGTLASLSHQLGTQLEQGAPLLVVVGPVAATASDGADAKARLERLHERLRLVVGSAVASVEGRVAEALDPAAARRLARSRGQSLLYLAPSLSQGQLLLSVDAVSWPRKFWQRSRNAEGAVTQHLALAAPVDAEVRSFLPRPRGLLERRASFTAPFNDVLSLSCGENISGATDLVIVGRRELARGRFSAGSFVVEARRSWSELSPVAGSPLRAPLAAARHRSDGVLVGSSDRGRLVLLDDALGLVAHGPRAWPLGDDRCAPFTESGIGGGDADCRLVGPTRPIGGPAVDASARPSLSQRWERARTDAAGILARFSLAQPVDASDAEFVVRSPLVADVTLRFRSGSVAELDDLDGDGQYELVTSSSTDDGSTDLLRVASYDGRALRPRAEVDLGPIDALTICPFAGENPLHVVVAAAGRLWVLG